MDRSGEIVLVELKVSEEFRVTDLQALAYAGAYAKRSSRDLARTLQRHLQKHANAAAQGPAAETASSAAATPMAQPADAATAADGTPTAEPAGATSAGQNGSAPAATAPTVSFEDAAAKIAAFIEVDDFADWQPSQHVRIKLVAPNFPRRVLQTVKWLGDVYSVRLEAITSTVRDGAAEVLHRVRAAAAPARRRGLRHDDP